MKRLTRTRRPVPLRRWRHWTLRTRLGLALVLLAGVALLAANAAGVLLLRSYLTDRVDEQLLSISGPLQRSPPLGADTGFAAPQLVPRARWPFGPDVVILLYDPDGTLVDQSTSGDDVSLPALAAHPELAARADEGPYTVDDDGDQWRAIVVSRPDGGLAVAAASLADVDETVRSLVVIDAVVMVGVLVVVGLVAAWVVRAGMVPLTRMEDIAAEITAGDLSRRVEDTDPHTEPGRLGLALNTMLGRIEREVAARTTSEQRLRQFVADASHELRTPLTSIRGFAELYRRGGAPPGPLLDDTMSRIEHEAARMGLLVDELILLARLDRQRPLERRRLDLLAIAADTVRTMHAQAPGRRLALAPLDEEFEPVTVLGDEHRLRQVATNLTDNAIRHTPPEAEVTVRVGRQEAGPDEVLVPGWSPGTDAAVLEVADTGPGIPAEHAQRVFERLYRVDLSRSRQEGGGSGLGLSIVSAIVAGHGGSVELSTALGAGCVFRVRLPEVPHR